MEKLKDIINNKYFEKYLNKPLLLLGSLILFVVKFIGDTLIFIIHINNTPFAVLWKLIFSIGLIILISLFALKDYRFKRTFHSEVTFKDYLNDLKKMILLTASLSIPIIILPDSIKNYGEVTSIFSLITIEVFSLYSLICGIILTLLIYKWLWYRRHKKTKLYIRILQYSLVIFFLVEIPFHFFKIRADDILNSELRMTILDSLSLIPMIVAFLASKKNSWIAVLPRKDKMKLLYYNILFLVIIILIMSFTLSGQAEGKFTMALSNVVGAETILYFPLYCLLPMLFRLIFAIIASLPTTKIVEQTNSEISSLTYLNNIIARTVDFDELLDTVTKLALQSCRGIVAWSEIYLPEGKVIIKSPQYITHEALAKLDEDCVFEDVFKNLNSTYIVESIPDNKKISELNWKIAPNAKSILATPLYSGEDRFGTLVVFGAEEYGFENNDIIMMKAYSDNVRVALDNARLLKESIDKERYKRELMLAREIEQKLLPQDLPEIKNFSIASFANPATEVGGDYYDIVYLKNGKPCILIGDVSGKGISAAFYMVLLKGVVISVAREADGAADILKRINATLYREMEKQMYITMSAFVIENNDGLISFARAGHLPLFINRSNGFELKTPKGLGIGLTNSELFDSILEEDQIILEIGNTCLLLTDGINELKNQDEEELDFNSLKQILKYSVYNSRAKDIVGDLKEKIEEYAEYSEQNDDMTIVALVYHGN